MILNLVLQYVIGALQKVLCYPNGWSIGHKVTLFKQTPDPLRAKLPFNRDIAKYQEVIKMFKIPGLDERFEMLRQLGNIFVVKPEILKSILSEGYLARLDPSVLYPYLEKRIDFKSAKLDRLLGISMDETSADANQGQSNTKTSDKSKTQRRSLFVNDNEVLKDIMKNYTHNRDFLAAFNLS